MARPATTDAVRTARTVKRTDDLTDAVRVATMSGLAEDWKIVATLAGNIQRDTRILAGLGRGG